MSRVDLLGRSRLHRFPRVSGDEPGSATPILTGGGFSPRERG